MIVIPPTKLELPKLRKVEGYTAKFMDEDPNHPYYHNRGLKMGEEYVVVYVNLQQPYSYITLKDLGGWFSTSGFAFFRNGEEIQLTTDENCWSPYYQNLMEDTQEPGNDSRNRRRMQTLHRCILYDVGLGE